VALEPVVFLLGSSQAVQQVIADAEAVAPTNAKVLITGESGVGKEVLARLIHRRSRRSHLPLVAVNCAGVPDSLLESELFGHVRGSFTGAHRDRRGLLEVANGGTIMLDEVGEMSLRMQGLLLRFLENGEIQPVGSERPQTIVDARVIAATNRDLHEQVRRGDFREDLYYRLNIVHLIIPPLRERREDIKCLFEHCLVEGSRQHRLPVCELGPDAVAVLEQHDWPGNVRELRNVAERLLLGHHGSTVAAADVTRKLNKRGAPAPPPPQQPTLTAMAEAVAQACFSSITQGHESFWSVVYEPFMARDMTRETVRAVVRMGLEHTKGSYRLCAELFNLPPQDYKRFLNFLQKHDCHMPFLKFRMASAPTDRDRPERGRNELAS
jgi:transcriptional regulator with PAS, ATPase and Fis domain